LPAVSGILLAQTARSAVMKKKANKKANQQLRPTPCATHENGVRALSQYDLAKASGGDDRTFNHASASGPLGVW
jgi:hypothetical protein